MNVVERIQELTQERGWTEYRLAKESHLSASTIANIFHRGTTPSISNFWKSFAILSVYLSANFLQRESLWHSHPSKRIF